MKIFLSMAALMLTASQCSLPAKSRANLLIHTADGNIPVQVEIANTPEELAKGLMDHPSLEAGEGMLFLFPQEQQLSFWMKNVEYPLDVLYIDKYFSIQEILTMSQCTKDPCPVYFSEKPNQYALELPAGFAETRGIAVNDRITFAP